MAAISFELCDTAGRPAILTVNDRASKFLLRLTNVTSAAIPLQAGAPLPEPQAGQNGDVAARWYLNFPDRIDNEAVAATQIEAPGWTTTPYLYQGRNLWGFVRAPALVSSVTDGGLDPEKWIDFSVTGLVVTASAVPSISFTADTYNIGETSNVISFSASVMPDPSTNKLSAGAQPPAQIYLSQGDEAYANAIVVTLTNAAKVPLPGSAAGVVTITVTYGVDPASDETALVEQAMEAAIQCGVTDPSNMHWERDTKSPPPTIPNSVAWTFKPTADPVLGPDDVVAFSLTDIVSHLGHGFTAITVEYAGFDGFSDASLPVPIERAVMPLPQKNRLEVSGQPLAMGAPICLDWDIGCATALTLRYQDGINDWSLTSAKDGLKMTGSQALVDPTGKPQLALTGALITLTASNQTKPNTVQFTAVVAVTPPTYDLSVSGNVWYWDFGAGPVSVSYTANPTPPELLMALGAVDENGNLVSVTGTTFTITRRAPTGGTCEATFHTGFASVPKVVTIDLPTIPSFISITTAIVAGQHSFVSSAHEPSNYQMILGRVTDGETGQQKMDITEFTNGHISGREVTSIEVMTNILRFSWSETQDQWGNFIPAGQGDFTWTPNYFIYTGWTPVNINTIQLNPG